MRSLFQLSTGCRIGEALAMRWSAIDLGRGEITLRLKVHNNVSSMLSLTRCSELKKRWLPSRETRRTVSTPHARA